VLTIHPSKADFGEQLSQVVTPSMPIQSIEHLRGRAGELDKIDKALYAPGRHVFIYGDRGVGKSSLAAAAGQQNQSSDAKYIDIGCAPDSTLKSVVANIAYQAISASRIKSSKVTLSGGLQSRILNLGASKEIALKNLRDELQSIGDAVEMLREVSAQHSERPVVVIDEFDRIFDPNERHAFADLLKQISDKKVSLRFIFTGVGKSLDDLLGAHPSAIRQLATLELQRLGWEGRWEIVQAAAREFKIHVPRDIYIRIAAISDGYPYYVHLLTEHLLWAAYEDSEVVTEVSKGHLQKAIRTAIDNITAELNRPYQLATARRGPDYEEVLWSTADSEYLERYAGDMYTSYRYVMRQRDNRASLNSRQYADRLRALRSERLGSILVVDSKIHGLISYRDRMGPKSGSELRALPFAGPVPGETLIRKSYTEYFRGYSSPWLRSPRTLAAARLA
jgi:hypothetical protein